MSERNAITMTLCAAYARERGCGPDEAEKIAAEVYDEFEATAPSDAAADRIIASLNRHVVKLRGDVPAHGTAERYDAGCCCSPCIDAEWARRQLAGITQHRDALSANLTQSKKEVKSLQRRAEKAEGAIRRVTGYVDQCDTLRVEPSTGGLREALAGAE